MAVVAYTILHPSATDPKKFGDDVHIIQWVGLTNGDTGAPLQMAGSADRSVQVEGTFGAGGNVRIEGSNDKSTYRALTDPQGNPLDVTAAKIEAVSELVFQLRPNVTAGDGTTSLTVSLLLRRPFK